MQLIEGTKGRRHRLVSIFNNMQTAESLKMQSVMLGGAGDPSAFMTEVGPFQYEAFRCGSPNQHKQSTSSSVNEEPSTNINVKPVDNFDRSPLTWLSGHHAISSNRHMFAVLLQH